MPRCFWQWFYLGIGFDTVVMTEFSVQEQALMKDAEMLLLKRQCIDKVMLKFASIESNLKRNMGDFANSGLPEGAFLKPGKISRGENYKGLPYVVLDYPRLFTQSGVLNIRLLFWWGHYFTMSLHLAGEVWERNKNRVVGSLAGQEFGGLYFQYEGSVWENDLSLPFFIDSSKLGKNNFDAILKSSFIKIVNPIAVDEIERLESFSLTTFKKFISLLQN